VTEIRYPHVVVRLAGTDIEGQVVRTLRAAGVSEVEITLFQLEHRAEGDDNVLDTVLRWVALDPPPKFAIGQTVRVHPGAAKIRS
jgi:hypothetical protein